MIEIVLAFSFLELLGVVLGGIGLGAMVFVVFGLLAAMFMDTGEVGSFFAIAAVPVAILAAIVGWVWLWGLM